MHLQLTYYTIRHMKFAKYKTNQLLKPPPMSLSSRSESHSKLISWYVFIILDSLIFHLQIDINIISQHDLSVLYHTLTTYLWSFLL